MIEDKDWLKGLRNKMKDYEEPAPESLWEDIESAVFQRKKRGVAVLPVLWRSMAVASAVALGVFAGVRLLEPSADNQSDRSQEILASGQPSSVNNDGGRDSSVEIVRKPESVTLIADSSPVLKRQAMAAVSGNEKSAVNGEKSALVTDPVAPEAEKVGAQSVTDESPRRSVSDVEPPARRREEVISATDKSEEDKPVAITADHDVEDWSDYISATDDSGLLRRNAAALDVSLSGGSVGSRNEDVYDLRMFYRGSSPASANGLIDNSGGYNVGNDAQIQTRGAAPMDLKKGSSTVVSNSEHKRPVRFALTVNVPLGGALGLETGAMFTTLHSTFTTEAGRTITETKQTLKYVGIPLSMTASLVDSRWFSLYLGGGGMVEKCISGKSVTTETLAGVKQSDNTGKKMNVKPLLWSLNASAGLQANLTRNIGLYIEPGVSYHFDDKSYVQTIYKERPLDFVLTFGARFSLK